MKSTKLPAEICFNGTSQEILKLPSTLQNLQIVIDSCFSDELPENWMLEYVDQSGQPALITNENDYQGFIQDSINQPVRPVRMKVLERLSGSIYNIQNSDEDCLHPPEVEEAKFPDPLSPSKSQAKTFEQKQWWALEEKALENLKLVQALKDQMETILRKDDIGVITPDMKTKVENTEEVLNLYEDFNRMPECAERSLLALKYLAARNRLSQQGTLDGLDLPPTFPYSEEFKILEERFKLENLLSNQVKDLIKKCQLYAQGGEWKLSDRILTDLLKEVRSLDVPKILRLIAESDKARDLNADEDIFLLLGGTGSGKSTTIHFLGGSKMVLINDGGVPHIIPVEIKNTNLRKIYSSCKTRSETRFVVSVTVDPSHVKMETMEKKVLCDSPGFEDTDGTEMEIVNTVSIKRAASRCRSIRPILLVSSKSQGDRNEKLKAFVEILVRMIPDIKEHVKSFVYFFTKYSDDQGSSIKRSIKSLMTSLKEKETEVWHVLNDMYEKTKSGPIIIDPLKESEAGKILDDLMKNNDHLGIQRPGEVFRCAMSEKAEGVLQEQADRYVLGIKEAVSKKDFKFAKYKLDELRSLQDVLESRVLEKALQKCKEILKECDIEVYKEAVEVVNYFFGEKNILDQAVILKYQKYVEQSLILKSLKEEYLEDASSDFDLMKEVDEKVEDLLQCIEQKEVSDPGIGQIFKKLMLLSKSFSGLKSKCQEARSKIQKKFEASCSLFLALVNSSDNDYEKIGVELTKVKESVGILQDCVGADLTARYEGLRQALYENLRFTVNKAEAQFKHSSHFDEKRIEMIRACILKLESLKDIETLRSHIQPQDMIEKILEPLLSALRCYFEELGKKIEEKTREELNQGEKETFDLIKGLLAKMKVIRELPKMQDETSRVYYETMEDVRGFLQKFKRSLIEKILKMFRENDKTLNAKKVKRTIELLLEINGWPEEIGKTLGNLRSDIGEAILEEYKVLCETLEGLSLSEDNREDIQKLDSLMMLVKDQIACFEALFPDLRQNREEAEKIFDTKVEGLLSKIQKFVDECTHDNQSDFTFRKAEKILECLKMCQKMYFKNVGADQIYDKLEKFMFDHRRFLKEQRLEPSYNTIREYMQNFSNGSKEYFGSSPNNSQNDMDISMNTTIMSRGSNGSIDMTPRGITSQIKRKLVHHKDVIRDSFERIKEMQTTLSSVFGGLEHDIDIKSEWKRIFHRDAEEFSEIMEGLRDMRHFRDLKLLIIAMKVLANLDDTFETGGLFGGIAKFHEGELNKAAEERKKEGFEEIDKVNTNYDEVCQVMSNFTDSEDPIIQKQFGDIKKKLNKKVSQLIEETEKLLACFRKNQITPEAAEKIRKNLKELEKIKTDVKEYLEVSLEKSLKDFETAMNKNLLEFIEGVENSVRNYCFKDAENKKEDLQSIQGELEIHLEEKIIDKIKNIDGFTVAVLDDLKKNFENKTVDDLSKMSLKRILPNFEPVNHDLKYSKVFEAVSQDISQAFKKELEEARNFKENDRSNPHFRIIDLTMSTLPKSIADDIKPHVDICKQDVLGQKRNQNSLSQIRVIKQDAMISNARLAEIKQSNDPQKIAKFLEDCNIECWSSELDEMKIHLIEKVDKLRLEACEKLQSQQIREVQTVIVTLSQYIESLFQYCPEIIEGNSVLQLMLFQVFEEVLASYSKLFEKKKISELEKTLIEKTEADFLLLVDFMNLMKCPSTMYVLDEEALKKINSKIDDMVDETLKYFKFEETMGDLTTAIEYADVSEINVILNSIKDLSYLFTTILNSSVTTSQLNRLANNANEVKNYGKMIQLLDKKLKENSKIIEEYFDKFFNQGMNKEEIQTMNDAVLNFLMITDFLDTSHKNLLESKGFEDLQKSFKEKIDHFYISILQVFTKEKVEEGMRVFEGISDDCVCNERFDGLIQEKRTELRNLLESLN